jgi:indole-3-glycerol phosphate synthase
MGADVILLIASILSPRRTMELALLARQTGMEVLLEIHSEEELDHLN